MAGWVGFVLTKKTWGKSGGFQVNHMIFGSFRSESHGEIGVFKVNMI